MSNHIILFIFKKKPWLYIFENYPKNLINKATNVAQN